MSLEIFDDERLTLWERLKFAWLLHWMSNIIEAMANRTNETQYLRLYVKVSPKAKKMPRVGKKQLAQLDPGKFEP